MNKKPLFYLTVGFLLLISLVASVALVNRQQTLKSRAIPDTSVSFTVEPTPIHPNDLFVARVKVNTGTNSIVGGDFNITYDRSKFIAEAVTDGRFLSNAQFPGTIDLGTDDGRLSFSIIQEAGHPARKGTGDIAFIRFKALAVGSSVLAFENTTIIAAINESLQNVLVNMSPATVNITTPSPTPTPTPSPSPTPTPTPTPTPSPTPIPRPDLVVSAVSWTPIAPIVGTPVIFKATIKNQGTANTPASTVHRVDFKVKGETVSWSDTRTNSMAPGASVTLSANSGPGGGASWTAIAGTTPVTAVADPTNLITESNETNNSLSANLVIAATTPTTTPTPTPTLVPTSTPTPAPKRGDVDGNGSVNLLDYVLLFQSYGLKPTDLGYDARANIGGGPNGGPDPEGLVNILDYVVLFENFGT